MIHKLFKELKFYSWEDANEAVDKIGNRFRYTPFITLKEIKEICGYAPDVGDDAVWFDKRLSKAMTVVCTACGRRSSLFSVVYDDADDAENMEMLNLDKDAEDFKNFLEVKCDYIRLNINDIDPEIFKPQPKDIIKTGYIPVEYNHCKELIEKARKYDDIMKYLEELGDKHGKL